MIAVVLPALAWLAAGGPDRYRGEVNLDGIPVSVLRHGTVVVVKVDQNHLEDLYLMPFERGKYWERVGSAAILVDGDLRFESRVGIRIHGGGTRDRFPKSFRLYFRPSLDAEAVPGELVGLDNEVSYRTLVAHRDARFDADSLIWHYLNPLAYDIARRIGVPTVRAMPMTFVINDDPPLPYVLMESLNLDWFEARFGHRDFLIFETKDASQHAAIRQDGPVAMLRARFGEPANWTLENIREVVDLENLSRWFLAVLFCGTRDELQGKMVLDRSLEHARWFWVAWDMDLSFSRKLPQDTPPWEYDTFQFWMEQARIGPDTDARIVILRHLFSSNAEYRSWFARLYATVRDYLVTPDFIEEALSRYEQHAALHGIPDRRYQALVREFLTHRTAALDEILRRRLLVDIR